MGTATSSQIKQDSDLKPQPIQSTTCADRDTISTQGSTNTEGIESVEYTDINKCYRSAKRHIKKG